MNFKGADRGRRVADGTVRSISTKQGNRRHVPPIRSVSILLAIADAPLAAAHSKPMSDRLQDVQEDADPGLTRRRADQKEAGRASGNENRKHSAIAPRQVEPWAAARTRNRRQDFSTLPMGCGCGKGCRQGTNGIAVSSPCMINPTKSRSSALRGATRAPVHDMDRSLPVNAPKNVTRKNQQLKARATAGQHIDAALSDLPISDASKASRKSQLLDLPTGMPDKRRRPPAK